MQATISGYPRLHLGLLDCGTASARRFGGLGFAVDALAITVTATTTRAGTLDLDAGFANIDQRAHDDVTRVLLRATDQHRLPGLRLRLDTEAPQHVGLGSKTVLLLACLHAAFAAAGRRVARSTIQQLSGRGGASGVGVWSFYRGGLIVDAGHARAGANEPLLPSGASRPATVPPVTARLPMPSAWRVMLVIPDTAGASGAAEVDFFALNTPVPTAEIHQAMTLAYHGIVPAVAERNLPAFSAALAGLQNVGFKRREVEAQPGPVRDLLSSLNAAGGVAAGLSSMGPTVLAVHQAGDLLAEQVVRDAAKTAGTKALGPFALRNKGHERLG